MSFYHSSIKVFANIRIHNDNHDGIKNRKTNENENNDNDNDATWCPRWITVEVRLYVTTMICYAMMIVFINIVDHCNLSQSSILIIQ